MKQCDVQIRKGKIVLPVLFVMFPFFEPYSIDMLISMNSSAGILRIVGTIYSLLRAGISGCMFALVLKTAIEGRICKFSKTALWLIAYVVFQVVSCFFNGSFSANMILALAYYSGFILLCERIRKYSGAWLLRGTIGLFTLLGLIGGCSILLYPDGFFNASSKAYAVYALGSKNAMFHYYFLLLIAHIFYNLLYKNGYSRKTIPIILLMMLTAYICDSANTMFCIALIAVLFVISKYFTVVTVYFRPAFL